MAFQTWRRALSENYVSSDVAAADAAGDTCFGAGDLLVLMRSLLLLLLLLSLAS